METPEIIEVISKAMTGRFFPHYTFCKVLEDIINNLPSHIKNTLVNGLDVYEHELLDVISYMLKDIEGDSSNKCDCDDVEIELFEWEQLKPCCRATINAKEEKYRSQIGDILMNAGLKQ